MDSYYLWTIEIKIDAAEVATLAIGNTPLPLTAELARQIVYDGLMSQSPKDSFSVRIINLQLIQGDKNGS